MSGKDPFSHILNEGKRADPRIHLAKNDADTAGAEELDPREYRAHSTSAKPVRLRLRCERGPGRSPPYAALLDILFNERFPSTFTLVFNFMMVHVTGKNLAGVVDAINDHRCDALVEFDATRFDTPGSQAPLIEKFEFEAGKVMEDLVTRATQPKRA